MPNLHIPLLLTRLSIALFLLPWQIMRFAAPDAAKGIASRHYKVDFLPDAGFTIIAVFWALLLLAFIAGFKKRISYGLVFVLHAIGTIMTIPTLLKVFTDAENAGSAILFYAAIPTAFAMLLLYVLRDHDTLLTIDK